MNKHIFTLLLATMLSNFQVPILYAFNSPFYPCPELNENRTTETSNLCDNIVADIDDSMGIIGDIDGSGFVDVDDLNAVINLILMYDQYKDYYPGNADIDGSEIIDVDDVNAVINIILNINNGGETDNSETIVVNNVSFKMIKVSGGEYYIGETEVTEELWEAVMGFQFGNGDYSYGAKFPVASVLWEDCQAFIIALNTLTGKEFRLPTEAEWEYAALGGDKSHGYVYAGSNNIDEVAWNINNSGFSLHPVAQLKPNELGIYDMSGNAWEWCQDFWGYYPYYDPYDPRYDMMREGHPMYGSRGGECYGPGVPVTKHGQEASAGSYPSSGFRIVRSIK